MNASIPRSTAPPRSARSWILACLALAALFALRPDARAEGKRPAPAVERAPNPLERVGQALVDAYFARHPEEALARGWPAAREIALGTFGTEATWRWRSALTEAANALAELDLAGAPRITRAQLRALADWLEAERLLLDARPLATSDPAGYVQRVHRVLRATAEAQWLKPEERLAKLAALLEELPAYFHDARLSLFAPPPEWIDVALRDLGDLQEELDVLARVLPARSAVPRPKARASLAERRPDANDAVEGFRRWLMEIRPGAGGRPPRMTAVEWARLVELTSGVRVDPSELKARCLRNLARMDWTAPRAEPQGPAAAFPAQRLARRAETAATQALLFGQEARILRRSLDAKSVVFEVEESLRTRLELVRLAPVVGDTQRVLIELAHPSWSTPRTKARRRELRGMPLGALGVRYGLAGEALFERARRKAPGLLSVLPETRLVREAVGLYALDWTVRADWIDNLYRASAAQEREFELQRGLEAARLVAALELHAEGLSLEEAALGFQRRTGVGEAVAEVEALEAQRDPRRGLGYLGWMEVRALEERLAARTTPRMGVTLALKAILRHPELRPSDLGAAENAPRAKPR